jgi:prolipoprotein diacylglyceryltransferase
MFPILLSVGPVTISTFAIFFFLSLFFAGFAFWKKAREEHYDEEQIFDVLLQVNLWGFVAGRLGYVLLHLDEFGLNPLAWVSLWDRPGISYVVWVAVASVLLYRRALEEKWDGFEILDFWSLSVSMGQIWLWIGFFLAGSYVGTSTQLPWGVTLPNVFDARHPVQLYAALASVGLYWFLSWVEYHYRTFGWYRGAKKSAETGFLWSVYLIATGVILSGVELLQSGGLEVMGAAVGWWLYPLVAIGGGVLLVARSGMQLGGLREIWSR